MPLTRKSYTEKKPGFQEENIIGLLEGYCERIAKSVIDKEKGNNTKNLSFRPYYLANEEDRNVQFIDEA